MLSVVQIREYVKMELLNRSQETWKFYQKFNASFEGCVREVLLCRDTDGRLLMNEHDVIERWKQYFGELLVEVETE